MKNLVVFALLLSIVTCAFFGCGPKNEHFTGKWNFTKISKIELAPDLDESLIDMLKEQYDAEDEKGLVDGALAAFESEKIFDPCYVNFDKKNTYTYDPAMDREVTWVFYKTGANEGFLSFYTELDPSDVTPDPDVFPPVVYKAETNTLFLTIKYIAFVVTIELSK